MNPLGIVPAVHNPVPAEGLAGISHAVLENIQVPAQGKGFRVKRQHARGEGKIRLDVERQRDHDNHG